MPKSYLREARHHLDRVRYYHEHAGPNGHSQAQYHYFELGKCYSKSASKRQGETPVLHDMYVKAGELMETMKLREAGKAGEPDYAAE